MLSLIGTTAKVITLNIVYVPPIRCTVSVYTPESFNVALPITERHTQSQIRQFMSEKE